MSGAAASHERDVFVVAGGDGPADFATDTCETDGVVCVEKRAAAWRLESILESTCTGGGCILAIDEGDHVRVWRTGGTTPVEVTIVWDHGAGAQAVPKGEIVHPPLARPVQGVAVALAYVDPDSAPKNGRSAFAPYAVRGGAAAASIGAVALVFRRRRAPEPTEVEG